VMVAGTDGKAPEPRPAGATGGRVARAGARHYIA